MAHICTEDRAVNNLIEAAEQLGSKYSEYVGSVYCILKCFFKYKRILKIPNNKHTLLMSVARYTQAKDGG